jgi:peptidoglycan hydrolase-like protein with peptidoglycan-binding domain
MPSDESTPNLRSARGHRRAGLGAGLAAAGAGLLVAAAPAAADAPAQLLQQGSAGPAVSKVQHALHIGATGRFNPGTERAVLAFQRRDGLSADGIVGPQTWDAVFHITPSPSSSSTSAGSTASGSSSTGGYSIPSAIVQCESGGNYSAVNPQSGAGGAYQILPSTWQSYGGQGLPQDASKAEQDRIAAQIYATQGRSAWSC